MTEACHKTRASRRLIFYSVLITAALTWVGAWIYHVSNWPRNQVVTFLFDDFDCRTFVIFEDPSLGEFDHDWAFRIRADGPQAVRLPLIQGRYAFWDLDGNGAHKNELEIGTFGYQDVRIGYSMLAIGAQLPCGRGELLEDLLRETSEVFETAIIARPQLSPTHGPESE